MSAFAQDLRVAARQLAARAGFTLIVVVTLALGIGATTTCFALLNGVAFKAMPFADADRLVALRVVDRRGSGMSPVSLDAVAALQQTRGTFSGSAAYVTRAITVAGSGVAERVQGADVLGDVFGLLGVPVQRGRALTAADAGTRVVVIGDDLWVRRLGSNPDVVGSTLSLDGVPYVVVGVAGRGFSFPRDSRVWTPLGKSSTAPVADVVARLEPGVSAAQADATLIALSAGILRTARTPDVTVVTIPLRQTMIGTKQRDMALFILAAAGLVLLVACANLAGLLAAHVGARKYEMALRAAVGASRLRLVRQLMTESGMLAGAGGIAGLILAQWGVDLLSATLGTPQGAEWIAFAIDARVVTFAVAASALTALLFGLAPAFGAARVDLRGVLQGDSGASDPAPGSRRARGVLVGGQLAVSIALVSGAASIVISSTRFDDIDPGFNRRGIVAARVALAGPAYAQPEQRFAFIDAAASRLRSLPGVGAVTAASHLPLIDRDVPYAAFVLEGAAPAERSLFGSVRFVDAGYIAAMDIPIRRGRGFTAAEARDVEDRAVVINETMARRYWPTHDAIGTRLRVRAPAAGTDGWYRIVGVVGDVSQRQLPAAPENQMYLPLAPAREVSLMIRGASDAALIAAQSREAIRALDSAVAVTTSTMDNAYEWYARDRRLQGLVIGSLGAIAMLLAGIGIYGVMSLMVSARSREIAVRMALGSSPGAVMRLVLAGGLTLASSGVAVGLFLAGALTAFLSSIFPGVRGFDAAVLSAAAALLGGVTVLSSWWPARRALRVDPMTTLKR